MWSGFSLLQVGIIPTHSCIHDWLFPYTSCLGGSFCLCPVNYLFYCLPTIASHWSVSLPGDIFWSLAVATHIKGKETILNKNIFIYISPEKSEKIQPPTDLHFCMLDIVTRFYIPVLSLCMQLTSRNLYRPFKCTKNSLIMSV